MDKFIESIISNLEQNGFPAKKVSLPTEKMFEIADKKGLSFNKVLDKMEADFEICSDIGDEKIIFSKKLAEMNQEDMMAQAQKMMSQMDPDELERIKNMFMKQ